MWCARGCRPGLSLLVLPFTGTALFFALSAPVFWQFAATAGLHNMYVFALYKRDAVGGVLCASLCCHRVAHARVFGKFAATQPTNRLGQAGAHHWLQQHAIEIVVTQFSGGWSHKPSFRISSLGDV